MNVNYILGLPCKVKYNIPHYGIFAAKNNDLVYTGWYENIASTA